MKIIITIFIISITGHFIAQYSTPGTGVVWNMDSLVQNSSIAQNTSANTYLITDDLTISATDSLFIIGNNIEFANDVLVTVTDAGLNISGNVTANQISAQNQGQNYRGFRLEGTSNVFFSDVIISGCGGIKVLTPEFGIQNCTIENNPGDLNSSGFIELSSGTPKILNNSFKSNELSAISSAANATVAPIIKNNVFYGNVTGNTNRPQINLSPSGIYDTTIIEGNTITGVPSNEMAGGIAYSALAGGFGNVIIRNNEISENRYGITILGNNLFALIEDNNIFENNIQNIPLQGGSGINLSGDSSSYAIISGNNISTNLWGITVQQSFKVNLGDSHIGGANPGNNIFGFNENSGETHALFNNTPNTINATNNCWDISKNPTLQNAENVISHSIDDNMLGEVTFDPVKFCSPVEINEVDEIEIKIYPNPIVDKAIIELPFNIENIDVQLHSVSGKIMPIVYTKNAFNVEIDCASLPNGVYVLTISGDNYLANKKVFK